MTDPIILGKVEAASRLGVGIGTLEKAAQQRRIPFTWKGRAYGWTEEQLHEIARMWEVRPAQHAPAASTRSEQRTRRTRRAPRGRQC